MVKPLKPRGQLRRSATLIAVGLVAAVAAPTAAAAVVDRVTVGQGGRNVTRGFSPLLFVELRAPGDYARASCCHDGDSGNWEGPAALERESGKHLGDATIGWSVGFSDEAKGAVAYANDGLFLFDGGPIVGGGPMRIPHVIGPRRVGTVPAYAILRQSPGFDSAQHEAVVAFALGGGVFGRAHFALLNPRSDHHSTANPEGEVLVNGILASSWNRQMAFSAYQGVSVVGNLPPRRVTVTGARRLTGAVTDAFRHPLVGLRVRLEQRAATGRWRPVGSARTNSRGRYILRTRGAGTFRVTATLSGSTARSKIVRVR